MLKVQAGHTWPRGCSEMHTMAEPTDDKNSEHGARTGFAAGNFGTPEVPNAMPDARTGFAAGSFGSPEEAPADTVMQRPPNLVLNQSSVAGPFVTGTDDASNQVVIRQTEAARRRFIDIINSEPSAGTNFGEARTHAAPIAASLTLSGTTPVVVQNAVNSPAAASLALSGATPTVVQNVQAVPAAASLALSSTPPDTEAIIPQQASGGSQFRLDESGRIDLVPDSPANTDRRQRELYDELRRKTRELSGLGHNQLGDLSTTIDIFGEALPDNIEAVSITRLWSRGNTLRHRRDAHEIAVGSAEPSDPARLTPLVAGQLRDLERFPINLYRIRKP